MNRAPLKGADAPLIVDCDGVLPGAIALQGVQPVTKLSGPARNAVNPQRVPNFALFAPAGCTSGLGAKLRDTHWSKRD